MQSRIISLLLILVTKIKIAKTNTCFLIYIILAKHTLRYNSFFDYNFNRQLKQGFVQVYNYYFDF